MSKRIAHFEPGGTLSRSKTGNYLAVCTGRFAVYPRHLSPDPILKKPEPYSYPRVGDAVEAIF